MCVYLSILNLFQIKRWKHQSQPQTSPNFPSKSDLPTSDPFQMFPSGERTTAAVYAFLKESWKKDPRWGGMASHLVEDVHPMFREGFGALKRQVLSSKARKVDVGWFKQLNNGLHHHHSLEDKMWFPQLCRLHKEVSSEVRILEADHRRLVELEGQICSGDWEALVEFCDGLFDHLNREEMITVPFLLDGTGGL
ncbi:hypothetical protein BDR26DRAFT_397511 [Obelidium mucronatum]|nr:hypothetical protein BDR26DRAFT_397511 [Obelidium mucronatum]